MGFLTDDRGQALQLDFLMSMVIRLVAFSVLLAASVALTYSMIGTDLSNKQAAKRGADRLANDLLVGQPSNTLLNETCTDAFFEASVSDPDYNSTCGFEDAWTTGSVPYLNDALYINESRHLNVTIERTNGTIATLNVDGSETRLALGRPTAQREQSVFAWHRRVGIDVDGDGTHEWATLYVRAW